MRRQLINNLDNSRLREHYKENKASWVGNSEHLGGYFSYSSLVSFEQVAFELRLEWWQVARPGGRKIVPGSGHGTCKGPEVGTGLANSRSS